MRCITMWFNKIQRTKDYGWRKMHLKKEKKMAEKEKKKKGVWCWKCWNLLRLSYNILNIWNIQKRHAQILRWKRSHVMRNVECIITPVSIELLLLLWLRLQCVAVSGIEMRALFCDIPICETCYLYCRAHFIYKQLTHHRITFICLLLPCSNIHLLNVVAFVLALPTPLVAGSFALRTRNLRAHKYCTKCTLILRELCLDANLLAAPFGIHAERNFL